MKKFQYYDFDQQRLPDIRKKYGLTQKQCADIVGVTVQHWQRYEYFNKPQYREMPKLKKHIFYSYLKNSMEDNSEINDWK